MFAYLQQHICSKIIVDTGYCDGENKNWVPADSAEFYLEAKEQLLYNAPEPRSNLVQINLLCNAAQTKCLVYSSKHNHDCYHDYWNADYVV